MAKVNIQLTCGEAQTHGLGRWVLLERLLHRDHLHWVELDSRQIVLLHCDSNKQKICVIESSVPLAPLVPFVCLSGGRMSSELVDRFLIKFASTFSFKLRIT